MKLCASVDQGLYFKCKGCGNCCSKAFEGYVIVYMNDIENLKKALKLKPMMYEQAFKPEE